MVSDEEVVVPRKLKFFFSFTLNFKFKEVKEKSSRPFVHLSLSEDSMIDLL